MYDLIYQKKRRNFIMSTKGNDSTRGTFSLELVKVPVRNHGEKGDRRKTNGGAGKSNSSQN
nr:MAG TPA: hypothetical protein [Caudoviricetes sp.]